MCMCMCVEIIVELRGSHCPCVFDHGLYWGFLDMGVVVGRVLFRVCFCVLVFVFVFVCVYMVLLVRGVGVFKAVRVCRCSRQGRAFCVCFEGCAYVSVFKAVRLFLC